MTSGAVSAFLVRQRIHELMRQFTDLGENRTFFPREGGPRIPRLMSRCHGQVPVSSCSELTLSFVAVVGDAIAGSSFPGAVITWETVSEESGFPSCGLGS